jgi:hypothetical protein
VSIKSLFAAIASIGADIEPRQPDFAYVDHGSVILLRPLNSNAWDWVADHIPPDSYTMWAGAVPCSRNLFRDILKQIDDAGMTYTD